jgi:hypothetical protein
MNANEQIKYIVDNTDGELWHEIVDKGTGLVFGPGFVPPMCSCGKVNSSMSRYHDNPSPHDLNALMRLAEKLGHDEIFFASGRGEEYPERCLLEGMSKSIATDFTPRRIQYEGKASTKSDALRSALVKAIEGRK